ncbi:hypothetical protein AaE_007001, partial [Aphanomyces astaci]
PSVVEAFHNEGTKYKVDFTPLPDGAEIEASEYLLVECPSPPTRLLHTVHGKHYMQFGRDAVAALLNMPRRGNWKVCTLEGHEFLKNVPHDITWQYCVVPKDEEEKMTRDFKNAFAPFDFTLALE